jgi:hypothetical protein
MKKLIIILVLITTISCSQNSENYTKHISGYWEIESVTLQDGSKRDYKINQTIDYFFVSDSLTGFRKKLQPNFRGTYTGSDNVERFKLAVKNRQLLIQYETPFNKWEETILFANKTELQIKNADNIIYLYKRFEPINIQ